MTDHEEAVRIAEGEYNNAMEVIRKCKPGKPGFGAEAKYGEAYQKLVLLGARPQIRKKYR